MAAAGSDSFFPVLFGSLGGIVSSLADVSSVLVAKHHLHLSS
jgi:hypothetical protein